jgi:GT2 family glycosyltransferase
MTCPKITIININYNSEVDCIAFIQNITNQRGVNVDVIIVDNNSPDGSGKRLYNRYAEIKNVTIILSAENGGFAKGNNIALKEVCSKAVKEHYIVISNSDIVIDNQNLLSLMIESYRKTNSVAFVSPLMNTNEKLTENFAVRDRSIYEDLIMLTPFRRLIRNKTYKNSFIHGEALEVDILPGAFFLGVAKVWLQICYFDEDTFLYGEERILGRKVRDLGMKNYVLTDLHFEHKVSSTISREMDSINKRKLILDGRIIYHKKYCKQRCLVRFLEYCSNRYIKKLLKKNN